MPNPIPKGYHSVTPYLIVSDAAKLMEFLTNAFSAKELYRMPGPDGRVAHAEMQIGDSMIMLGQPRNGGAGQRTTLYLYVPDVDATYQQSVKAGGTSIQEPKTQFYGDRNGSIRDPFGNEWYVATHVEDVSPEEMKRRMSQQTVSA